MTDNLVSFDCGKAKNGRAKNRYYVSLHGVIKNFHYSLFANSSDWFGWFNEKRNMGGFHYEVAFFKLHVGVAYPNW